MADDVRITVRVTNATGPGLASVNAGLNQLTRQANSSSGSLSGLKGAAISLAPALLPIAASVAPIAVGLGAATIAVGAFGAAIIPQIKAMSDAASAETKYKDAVDAHGKASKQAAKAEGEYLRAVTQLPPATRVAAAGLSVLKDEYKQWSDSLADDTMPVATKAFAVFGALFPKLTPLVKGASGQLDRFVTIVAGGIQSRAFDRFMNSFSTFATGALDKANDGLIRFTRTMNTGKIAGGASEFMQYARENGPVVASTLKAVGQALTHLLVAASDVGVGLLTVVNAFAQLVSSLPTGMITTLLQVAIAFKLVRLAAMGMATVGGVMTAASAGVAAFVRSARFGGVAAAITGVAQRMTMLQKATVGLMVLAGVVLVLHRLSTIGDKAAPSVDRLTTSLGELGRTGKVTGEAAKAFGSDLKGLGDSLQVLARPSTVQQIDKAVSGFLGFGKGGPDTKKAAEALDAVDKALSNLVSGGKADLAAAAYDRIQAAMVKQGFTSKEVSKEMGDYKSALADAAFEAKLIADSMGLFGEQAMAVKTKLDAQKASADGLRQAIQALNDVNRSALGGMIGFEAAIDAATKAASENAGSLRMVHGALDLNSEKARTGASALQDLAAKTDEAAAAARESGQSWAHVNGIYQRGTATFIAAAQGLGLTRQQAAALAKQMLNIPDKTLRLKGNLEDLQAKLRSAKVQLGRVPDSRKAAIRAQISQLTAAIAEARRRLAALNGATATTNIVTRYYSVGKPGSGVRQLPYAHGGVIGAAGGGPRSRMTLVGEQGPELVDLAPGSRVRSNPDTKRLMSGTGGGGGGSIHLTINLGGQHLGDLLIDPLRKTVRTRGGNVQAVLGSG